MGEEKKEQVIVEGTLYEFSNNTIHTVTEGFVFEEKGWFSKKLSEHLHNREYYDYEQYANELMAKYYDYYQQIKEIDYEYVLRGAVLTCTHGNKETRLDALKDHGVYFRNQPVMTCRDCELEKNIFSFGACGNEKFEPLYSEEAPHPAQTAIDRNGQVRYVCLPILLGEWGYGDVGSRSLLIGEVFIDKMYKVYKKESFDSGDLSKDTIEQIAQDQSQNAAEDVEYSQALMKCDNLLCLYGGVITIKENPFKMKRKQDGLRRKFNINKGVEDQKSESDYEFKYDWMKEIPGRVNYVTEEALKKVVKISADLEIDPDDLMAVMAFESWLNPHEQIGDDGACGLIQFTQIAIDQINIDNGTAYTKESIKQMDIVEQLDVVYLHLKPNAGKMKNLEDVYVGVFASTRVKNEILYDINIEPNYYEQNKGLDENQDGKITKSEAAKKVIERRDTYFRYDDD